MLAGGATMGIVVVDHGVISERLYVRVPCPFQRRPGGARENEHGFALSMSLQTELIWSGHRVDSKENFVLTSTKSNMKGAGMGKSC
jgi:hypothetical protein